MTSYGGELPLTPPERNNPGYTPVRKELEEAREMADQLVRANDLTVDARETFAPVFATRWLAAEVRVMRLERALER